MCVIVVYGIVLRLSLLAALRAVQRSGEQSDGTAVIS